MDGFKAGSLGSSSDNRKDFILGGNHMLSIAGGLGMPGKILIKDEDFAWPEIEVTYDGAMVVSDGDSQKEAGGGRGCHLLPSMGASGSHCSYTAVMQLSEWALTAVLSA